MFWGFALMAVVGLAGCSWCERWSDNGAVTDGNGEVLETMVTVKMTDNLRFVPERLTIDRGQTVEWKNASDVVHTVTAMPERAVDRAHVRLPEGAVPFDSGTIQPGQTYRYTFTVPGLYRYFSIPHETTGMIGEVEVRD